MAVLSHSQTTYVSIPVPLELSSGEHETIVRVMSAAATALAAAMADARPIHAHDTGNQHASPRAAILLERLTEREREVVECIARGLEIKEIASELDISYESVKKNIARAKSKLGVRNQLEVAILMNGGCPQAFVEQLQGLDHRCDIAPTWRDHLRYNTRQS